MFYKGVLAFLHIGKAGGTSFDRVGQVIAKEINYLYHGNHHFDWSGIDNVQASRDNLPVEVVTMLREPVARAVSHFYFWQDNNFFGGKTQNQTLGEWLFEGDKQTMLDTRDIWQDGQAGVSWFTGTHIARWVVPHITNAMIEKRELVANNYTQMLPLAASRLRETKWFGILEDMNRSMILLQHTYNLSNVPTLPHQNRNEYPRPPVTDEQREALVSLMPQDIWLHKYAQALFEARWQEYLTGAYTAPEEPKVPKLLPCRSTRFRLQCMSGPLMELYAV